MLASGNSRLLANCAVCPPCVLSDSYRHFLSPLYALCLPLESGHSNTGMAVKGSSAKAAQRVQRELMQMLQVDEDHLVARVNG